MACLAAALALAAPGAVNAAGRPSDAELWSSTLGPYLADPLWSDRDAYDAGDNLLIPQYSAFLEGHQGRQLELAQHWARFVDHVQGGGAFVTAPFHRLIYLYVAGRFQVLAAQAGRANLIPAGLEPIIRAELARQWNGGMRTRIVGKLNTTTVERSHQRVIGNQDNYALAVAADLRSDERRRGLAPSALVADVLDVAERVYRQEVAWTEDRWVLQPGAWTDHPDYAYAGRTEEVPGMEPLKVPGIAWDTGHSRRFPLWLRSLAEGADPGSERRKLYERLLVGLEEQFATRVLVAPGAEFPVWRVTNFMDGHNGVYRWGYTTLGEGAGYGPHELSGGVSIGTWSVLGTSRMRAMYRDLAAAFPLAPEVLTLYAGPDTSRDQHPLVKDSAEYTNGLRELTIRLASRLPPETLLPARSVARVSGGRLRYSELTETVNRVTISRSGGVFRIRDSASTIFPAAGCSPVSANEVTCPARDVPALSVDTGAGDDSVTVRASAPAEIAGGAGDDVLRAGPGPDRLSGGSGTDSLDGGLGADVRAGGTGGHDRAVYTSRTAPVEVTLDDEPDDGEPGLGSAGEGDDVRSDVERVYGGTGDDRLTGSPRANFLFGGPGNDVLHAADSSVDAVRCREGDLDVAVVDRRDVHADCELVTLAP